MPQRTQLKRPNRYRPQPLPRWRSRVFLAGLPLALMSVLFNLNAPPLEPSHLETVPLTTDWESPWLARLLAHDPAMDVLVQNYVAQLDQEGWAAANQGVWIQAGDVPIVQHQGDVPLSAASLTKLATTLTALSAWKVDQRFETRIGATGPVQDGVLMGDLVVVGGSDPLFVWEEAIALANQLQALGIQRVSGNLVIAGDFTMNFETEPLASGDHLKQAFNSQLWPREARTQYAALPPDTPMPSLVVDGDVQVVPDGDIQVTTWLVNHQSLPLIALLKAMNIYSNNVMAEEMAQLVGGPATVMATVNQQTNMPPGEVSLINGSGLGEANQISPRAVVAMLAKLQKILEAQGFSVLDVLPVAGQDGGTLSDRQLPVHAAVKTGTLNQVSALAGVLPTQDRGPVWFALINRGWAIGEFREKQDAVVQAMEEHWGVPDEAQLWQPKIQFDQDPYRLGDPKRNQVIQNP